MEEKPIFKIWQESIPEKDREREKQIQKRNSKRIK